MPDLSLDTRCSIPDDVISRELEGETVILNLETGIYFGLDPVGTRIWKLLNACARLGDVHERMLEEFNVDADVLARDLLRFAAELNGKGLLTVSA